MKYSFQFVLSIIVLLTQFSVFATEKTVSGLTDYSGTWWFNLGAGAGNIFGYDNESIDEDDQTNNGPAGTVSFNYAVTDNQLLTVRTSVVDFQLGTLFGPTQDKQIERVFDFGVLYGLMHKSDMLLASISAGLAYTGVEYEVLGSIDYDDNDHSFDSNYNHNVESTIGVPLEAQVFWTPTSFLGLGLIGLANINSEASYVAGLVAIQVGNLK